MPTLFPGGIDSYVNPSAGSQMNDPAAPHTSSHDNLQDGMTAVQTFVLGAISASLSASFNSLSVASLSSLHGILGVGTASINTIAVNFLVAGGSGIGPQVTASMPNLNVAGSMNVAGAANFAGATSFQGLTGAGTASINGLNVAGVASIATLNFGAANIIISGTASINTLVTQSLSAFQGIIVAGTASHAGRINAPAVGTSGKPLLNWVPITRQLTTYSAGSTAGGFFSMAIASLPSWSPTAYVRLLPLSVNSSTTSMTIALGDGVGNTMQQTQYSVINATIAIGPTELTGLSVASGGCIQPFLSITGPSQAALQVSLFGYYEPS